MQIIKLEGNTFLINRGANSSLFRLNDIVFINNLSLLHYIMALVVKHISTDCVSLIIFNLFILINFRAFVLKIA